MGFFNELKSDLSQAVNTILPSEDDAEAVDPLLAAALAEEPGEEALQEAADDGIVISAENTGDKTFEDILGETGFPESEPEEEVSSVAGMDLDSMLSKLDELDAFEETAAGTEEETAEPDRDVDVPPWKALEEEETDVLPAEDIQPASEISEDVFNEAIAAAMTPMEEPVQDIVQEPPVEQADLTTDDSVKNALSQAAEPKAAKSRKKGNKNDREERNMEQSQQIATPTDENAVITAGMLINGDVTTSGSLDVIGKINGNVTAYGKLNVTGTLDGNLTAAEIYAENARITGEVRSQGAAKIGQSTVIIGNIYATSAVVAGAVKGDIDVHGPVVLDTTAIVMGNIKSQSVQINNGAVVEGMCSQVYAEVNPQAFFDGLDNL